jgi:hypothetical protein
MMELPPLEFVDFNPQNENANEEEGEQLVVPDLSQLPDIFVSLYHGGGAQKLARAQVALARCLEAQAEAESGRGVDLQGGRRAQAAQEAAQRVATGALPPPTSL